VPETPEIHILTEQHDVEASAALIIGYLRTAGVLGNPEHST
jgi:adenylylsulfate kinase-like enzyme